MRGIYKITQISTGLVYIGQTINMFSRWHQHINAVDNLSFHKDFKTDPTDFTFEILTQSDDYTKEDLDRLEKQYITDYKSNDLKYGFNATAGNGKLKKQTKPTRMLEVKKAIVQEIFDKWVENKLYNINVLIIGEFRTIPEYLILKKCKVKIFTDDFDYTCEEAKIIRVDGGDELMSKVKEIKKGEYDLIIANPPYNIGNKIINSFVGKAKESIVLAPLSCYKGQDLYKHIVDLQLVDPKAFEDADITNNLNIAKLLDRKMEQTWEEIESLTFNENYKEFYQVNNSVKASFQIETKLTDLSKIDIDTWFLITFRTITDGVHKTSNCLDYTFNINFDNRKEIPYDKYLNSYSPRFLIFNSKSEKEHFNIFWYKNPLMNDLIRGLNKTNGYVFLAIPNIDWSKERDYEKCTLEDIMNWLREDNK